MKILLLSDANSPHTIKWAKSLSKKGLQIGIWSFNKPTNGVYDDSPEIEIQFSSTPQNRTNWLAKFRYITSLSNLRSFISDFQPDILHAHYATSYGLLGRLAKFRPYIISVWGADVYDFPKKTFFFKNLVKSNLAAADIVLSTSEDMKKVTSRLTDKEIIVTPFGIDLTTFFNSRSKNQQNDKIVIGTIKTLEEKYGIKYLIEAYRLFKDKFPTADTELLIVGGGTLEQELKNLAISLGIFNECKFTGQIPYSQAPFYHNQIDIAVFPSILDSESFGVAAIEASATETPVIVSNVGGLPEVIEDGITGIVVPPKSPAEIANAIEKLYLSKNLRLRMGINGRKRVKELYDLENNLSQMVSIYDSMTVSNK